MSTDLLGLYYGAFNRGDGAAMLALLTDDVIHEPSQGAVREGKAAFAEFIDHMTFSYKEEVIDPVFMVSADGSRGAAEFMLTGAYLQTDGDLPPARSQHYRLRVGAFFVFQDGRISRVSNHYNLVDWLDQVA